MDIIISQERTGFTMVAAVSEEGRAWVDENVQVPDYASSSSFPVEGRYIESMTIGMLNAGLAVEINGHPAHLSEDGDVMLTVSA
jgi:hypothetical protein